MDKWKADVVLVTGANRDVTNESEISKMVEELNDELEHRLDLLINNAGAFFDPKPVPCKCEIPFSITSESSSTLVNTYKVNVVGPFLVTRALIPLMTKGPKDKNNMPVVFNMASQYGSIEENVDGGMYNYRLSKAALNMLTKNFAIDLAGLGIMCVGCHPGWVQTKMGGPNALIDTKTSVLRMIHRIIELAPRDNGKFISCDNTLMKY